MGNVYNGLLQRNPNRQRANMLQKYFLGFKKIMVYKTSPLAGEGWVWGWGCGGKLYLARGLKCSFSENNQIKFPKPMIKSFRPYTKLEKFH